jgi:septum site-determining protein MinC
MRVAAESLSLPKVQVRGRSFMALTVAPTAPLKAWLAALDQHLGRTAALFADRPIVADLSAAAERGQGQDQRQACILAALDGLAARNLRVIGVQGIDAALLAGTRWARLPTILHGGRHESGVDETRAADTTQVDAPPAPAPSLLIDRPVRSGQSIYFEEGDITIVGAVASGAEVVAGGSIHVYGALRGRAIAGVKAGERARIFCRRLEAELVAVDGVYLTAEEWGASLQGCAVQIRCEQGVLRLQALD